MTESPICHCRDRLQASQDDLSGFKFGLGLGLASSQAGQLFPPLSTSKDSFEVPFYKASHESIQPSSINESETEHEDEPLAPAGVEACHLHWPLAQHCSLELYPCPLPALAFPTRGGRMLWRRWHRCRVPDLDYTSTLMRAVMHTLLLMCIHDTPVVHYKQINLSEFLIDLRRFDATTRKKFFSLADQFLCTQDRVECACLDRARLTELEAAILVAGLVDGSKKALFQLHLWDAVVNREMQQKGSEVCTLLTGAISGFQNLYMLSVNYSFIGRRNDGIEVIRHLIGDCGREFVLQLLCTNGKEGSVADKIWKDLAMDRPGLLVNLLIAMRPVYDDVRQFFSKYMPLAELCIFHATDVSTVGSWGTEMLLRMVSTYHGKSLGRLCLHISRPPELLRISALFRGNLQKDRMAFDNLQVLELCSMFELNDVERALKRVSNMNRTEDKCGLKYLYIRLQVPYGYTWKDFTEKVTELHEKYASVFRLKEIKFRLDVLEV